MNANKPTLYLIRGVSGSGKSTLALRLCEDVVEADDFFTDEQGNYNFDASQLHAAHSWVQNEARYYLRTRQDICVSNTSTRAQDVETYKRIAGEHGANFVSLIVENYHESGDVHGVPEATLARQEKQLRASIKLR